MRGGGRLALQVFPAPNARQASQARQARQIEHARDSEHAGLTDLGQVLRALSWRLSQMIGISPMATSASAGKAASPKRSSRANW